MNITVWTLASDDKDSGTQASVFLTEREAYQAYHDATFTDSESEAACDAQAAIDNSNYDSFLDIVGIWLDGSLDTYSVDSQQLAIAALKPVAVSAQVHAFIEMVAMGNTDADALQDHAKELLAKVTSR